MMAKRLKYTIFLVFFLFMWEGKGAFLEAKTLYFSDRVWEVRNSYGGPGPNYWSDRNAWVDNSGFLHLKITYENGKWYCPEVITQERLGFGQYVYYINTRTDNLDPNVIFGLFHYPTADVGPVGTHGIGIEFGKRGKKESFANSARYRVWPVELGMSPEELQFDFQLFGSYTTFGYTWDSCYVLFQGCHGHYQSCIYPIKVWAFVPDDPLVKISQEPMPLHINLSLWKGIPPTNWQEVEVVIERVFFYPTEDAECP